MSKISGAESQIMEALWAKGPLTADEIVQAVGPAQSWGEATVKTLINRLLKKKALASVPLLPGATESRLARAVSAEANSQGGAAGDGETIRR